MLFVTSARSINEFRYREPLPIAHIASDQSRGRRVVAKLRRSQPLRAATIVASGIPQWRVAGLLSSSTSFQSSRRMIDKVLFSGMVWLHVLHHADEGPIFGLAIIEELGRRGYEISAGTMYPILHGLERKGFLVSRYERREGRERRIYRITPLGRRALEIGRTKARELFGELIAGHRRRRRAIDGAKP